MPSSRDGQRPAPRSCGRASTRHTGDPRASVHRRAHRRLARSGGVSLRPHPAAPPPARVRPRAQRRRRAEERDIAMINETAAGAIAVERQLHESFFSDLGSAAAPTGPQPGLHQLPAGRRLRGAEALAAPVPATSLGGRQTATRAPAAGCVSALDRNLRWRGITAIVQAASRSPDCVGENLSTNERDSMLGNFQTTARYELGIRFWEERSPAAVADAATMGALSSAASDRLSWSAPTHLRACQCVPVFLPLRSRLCPSSRRRPRAASCSGRRDTVVGVETAARVRGTRSPRRIDVAVEALNANSHAHEHGHSCPARGEHTLAAPT